MPLQIDAHLHLWDLSGNGYRWLTPDFGILYRTYTPAEAWKELDGAGLDAAILVQADDTDDDTRFLLDVASAHSWVAGVVGWVPLDNPDAAQAALAEHAAKAAFVGVRHLVHNDPRDGFLSLPPVRESLRLLAGSKLVFDVPNAFPRHLEATLDLARDLPELTVVLDHLGKPPRGDHHAFVRWKQQFRRFAELPNVVGKLSGLAVAGQPLTTAALEPVWTLALETFGPDRLMYGGDWPVSLLGGSYRETRSVLKQLTDQLSSAEKAAVLGGTAETVYLRRGVRPPVRPGRA